MKPKQFCCEANKDLYEQYYNDQCGSGMPVYHGSQMQRGHGLGSVLSGLFRNVWPLIRNDLRSLGKQALKTGVNVANDVVAGSSFKDSARNRVPEGIKTFVSSQFGQSGSGKRKRRISVKRKKPKLKKRKTAKDIFD